MKNLEELKKLVDELLSNIPKDVVDIEIKESADHPIGSGNKEKIEKLNQAKQTLLEKLKKSLQEVHLQIPEQVLKEYIEDIFDLSKKKPLSLEKNLPPYSRHGFDFETYRKLLPYTKLARLIENSGSAEEHAFKLAVLFGNRDSNEALNAAWHYLLAFSKKNLTKANEDQSTKPLHDALLPISLPDKPVWNIEVWRELAKKHALDIKFLKSFGYADKITAMLNSQKRIYDEIEAAIKDALKSGIPDKTKTGKMAAVKKAIDELLSRYSPEDKAIADHILYTKKRIQEMTEQQNKLLTEIGKLRGSKKSKKEAGKTEPPMTEVTPEKPVPIPDQTDQLQSKQQELKVLNENLAQAQYEFNFDLNKDTSPKRVLQLASQVRYEKVTRENKHIAELFMQEGMSEKAFDLYLSLQPSKDTTRIPIETIAGEDINPDYRKYYLKRLDRSDPRAAVLGKLTACCQSLLGAGGACAVHGITSDNGGFYVICRGDPKKQKDTDEIISQCWAWRSKNDNLVFDSIETQPVMRTEKGIEMVNQFYSTLANNLVDKHHIPMVSVGTSGATPDSFGFDFLDIKEVPQDYSGYRDSENQRLVAADVNAVNEQGRTILHEIAAVSDKKNPDKATKSWPKIISFLVRKGANVSSQDKNGDTALHIFARNKHWHEVRELLTYSKGFDFKLENSKSETLEGIFLEQLNLEPLKYNMYLFDSLQDLVRLGFDVNKKNKKNVSIVDFIFSYRSEIKWDVIKMLFREGKLEVNQMIRVTKDRRSQDSSILNFLLQTENWDMIDFLLDMKLIDLKNQKIINELFLDIIKSYNRTFTDSGPTNYVKRKRLFDLIKTLDQKSTLDFTLKNNLGETPLIMALKVYDRDMIEFLFKNERIQSLDVNATDSKGNFALIYAIEMGDLEYVQNLIANQADVNLPYIKYGQVTTALHRALELSPPKLEIVQALVEANADLNAKDANGQTALEARSSLTKMYPSSASPEVEAIMNYLKETLKKKESKQNKELEQGKTMTTAFDQARKAQTKPTDQQEVSQDQDKDKKP